MRRSLVIGSVTALRTPDDPKHTLDDRQELVQTVKIVDGLPVPTVEVIDGGLCEEGEKVTYTQVTFLGADWPTIYGYVKNRTKVSVTHIDGTVVNNCRILATGPSISRFSLVTTDVEIWKV